MFRENPPQENEDEIPVSSPDHFLNQNHKLIAVHLEESANYYKEAARYREKGDLKRSHKNFVLAFGHCCTARELMREEIKNNRSEGQ